LDDNGITGAIPIEIGSLKDLDMVVLCENEISGTLPVFFVCLFVFDDKEDGYYKDYM
jgi:hypothetical protein